MSVESNPEELERTTAPLLRGLEGLAIVLIVLHALLFTLWGQGEPAVALPWVVPTIHSFLALAALSIAFLAFGRYAVLHEAPSLWTGVAFSALAVFALFYALFWPGLLPDGPSLVAGSANVSSWFWHLQFTALAVFLLIGLLVPWPGAGRGGVRWVIWLLVGLATSLLVGWLSVVFHEYLPTLVVWGTFNTLNLAWSLGILVSMVVGTILSAQRYRRAGDTLFGYTAFTELILAFAVLTVIVGGQVYDLWWYWQRVLWIVGLSVMLFGLLSDYVRLYQRERHYLEVAEERAAKLSATIENMADMVIVLDPSGGIAHMNPTAERALGLSREDHYPESLAETDRLLQLHYLDGRPIPLEKNPLVTALHGTSLLGQVAVLCRADGREMYLNMNFSPVRNRLGETTMVVAVLRDVTQLRALEKLREEFLSAAAHELKTPVTTIKGYVQLMRRWSPQEAEPREQQALEVINTQCNRISRRVEEMLEAVRSHSGQPGLHKTSFDLDVLAEEVAQRFRGTYQPHQVVLHRNGAVPVEADRDRLEEVLSGLLDNAIRFSPPEGLIEIEVGSRAGQALLSITDHGVGIPKERQPNVFEPFYEAIPSGAPGYRSVVALSLYLSKITVERHGGRIWFESQEGKGSSFYVSLPLAGSQACAAG